MFFEVLLQFGNKKEHNFFLCYTHRLNFFISLIVFMHTTLLTLLNLAACRTHITCICLNQVIPLTHHRVLDTTPYGDSESFVFALLLTK